MKVVCIIQARTGSTRLPGKVLKKICGKSILEHDIDRLRRIKNIDDIVIATTGKKQDSLIVDEALRIGVKYFRGSEEDVLARYYYAANKYKADVVVRVTSDCPLIDSKISESIIQYYLDNIDKYDYVSNTIERTYPRGMDTEVFSFKALERAFNEAKSHRDREHVTPYIWDNTSMFTIKQYVNNKDYSNLRWTVDTKEDFELIEKIYTYLYSENIVEFDMNNILSLYKSHNELNNINTHIMQKHI